MSPLTTLRAAVGRQGSARSSWAAPSRVVMVVVLLLATVLTDTQAAKRVRNKKRATKPNVLFVLMDDVGWRDVGWRDPQFSTPTLDALWDKAIRFNNSYTPPNCGASRAALLSGIYPWKMGLQGNAINSKSPAAIPLRRKILPQKLKYDLGYQTHLVGKWHQGFCKKSQTPTARGFDSFFGFYLTKQDHFAHTFNNKSYDFRSNFKVDRSVKGQYSTYIYSQRTRDIITEYKTSLDSDPDTKPFFILLSYAAIHGPNQVPQEYIDNFCSGISDPERQKKCGMMAAVDEGLRNITDTLTEGELMDNTLIVFTSDNGGRAELGSSNWPLRGTLRTLWEGGIKVNTFMYSKSKDILPKRSFTWEGLFYISDFYSTLVGLIENSTKKKLPKVPHSLNQWPYIRSGMKKRGSRKGFSYVDQNLGVAMTRDRNWKLLYRQSRSPGWYNPPPGVDPVAEPSRRDLDEYQLFDMDTDPTESNDVKGEWKEQFDSMHATLTKIRRGAKEPIDVSMNSDPQQFKGVWSPGWCKGKRT